jgi:putative transposase
VCHKSKSYPSDLTDEEWVFIEQLDINKHWGSGRKMTLELRNVINAILYVLRTGYQWRYLSSAYPNYNSVYYDYRKWCRQGAWW